MHGTNDMDLLYFCSKNLIEKTKILLWRRVNFMGF